MVGIGTSAITLAVSVALRLSANVSFTFNDSKRPGQPKRYFVEVRPSVIDPGLGKVLVLDDIIAVGHTASRVISELKTLGVQPQNIIHVSLFRLGSKAIQRIPGVAYHQLCHVKAVNYEKPERCRECRAGKEFVSENQLT